MLIKTDRKTPYFYINDIVDAFENGRLKDLYDNAKKMIEIRDLENMWYDEFDKSEIEINIY